MIHKKCEKCNKVVPSESKFCLYCGSPLIMKKNLRIETILEDLKNKKPTEDLLFKLTDELKEEFEDTVNNLRNQISTIIRKIQDVVDEYQKSVGLTYD